ncbi:MAG: DUF3732 domain-containing protein [Crocinitomix sp.]|nr:DUF3732 domain-containing protein [Crocinitomix sp.]
MKFILNEIRLWFKDDDLEPKSYEFLPNKINVITGDSTKGKTSFWNIMDYCLLSGKVTIPTEIIEKVLWFGINFKIGEREISIVRKTPSHGSVSSDVFFGEGKLPITPIANSEVSVIKSTLDRAFGINDKLRFPFGKEAGKTTFNISYRHFLLFNSLTQTIIFTPETYFDTTFYGKEDYDKALTHIYNLVIGVNDMEKIKALERLEEINEELLKIKRKEDRNKSSLNNFNKSIFALIDKSKQNNFIDYDRGFNDIEEAVLAIEQVLENAKQVANNTEVFKELDQLQDKRNAIRAQISSLNSYKKEFDSYTKNLNKSADSLQPINFLKEKLSDQLVDSYETKTFIDSLESSLKSIKSSISKKQNKPLKVDGDVRELTKEKKEIEAKIDRINLLKRNYDLEANKFMAFGEIKVMFNQTLTRKTIKPIDTVKLNRLNEEKERLEKVPSNTTQIKNSMNRFLNESIQRNFDQLESLAKYKNSSVEFNSEKMLLQLFPEGQIFPLDNVGSASNYMFMHLCFYLGLHEHIINIEQEHVPQFLFIDQPSTPYYEGKNDDKTKLIDAFTLLNSFVKYIVEDKKNDFQIFMVEHAPKEYWVDNNLSFFHTVAEFTEGNGLIPNDIFND